MMDVRVWSEAMGCVTFVASQRSISCRRDVGEHVKVALTTTMLECSNWGQRMSWDLRDPGDSTGKTSS